MDPAARRDFEALAYPLLDSAWRTARRMTRDDAGAEDLVQEAVLKAFRGFAQFERGTNFKAWFFRILANAFLNDRRRAARGPRPADFTEDEPEDPALPPAAFAPEEVEELRRHLGDEASRALDRVPEEFRLPFLLSTYEGFSYREISQILGIPIGTVMSRLFRARKLLRGELMDYAVTTGFLKSRESTA